MRAPAREDLMEERAIETMTSWIRGLALPLIAIAFAAGASASWARGLEMASGAAAGAALALANWWLIRWMTRQIMRSEQMRRGDLVQAKVTSVLAVKTGGVLAVAAVLLRVFDATGLVIGVSTMVIGIVVGALVAHSRETEGEGSPRSGEREVHAAR